MLPGALGLLEQLDQLEASLPPVVRAATPGLALAAMLPQATASGSLTIGADVEIHSLATASAIQLNGVRGQVVRIQGEWAVVELADGAGEKALKISNLKLVQVPSMTQASSSPIDLALMAIRGSASSSALPSQPVVTKRIEKAWPNSDGWRQIRKGEIPGETWGPSSYILYEVCQKDQVHQDPYLFIWLHGADGTGVLETHHMVMMQKRLCRRCFVLVPTSPKPCPNGWRFDWGVRYTKADNRNEWGFIYGEMHAPYLLAFCKLVQQISEEFGAVANIMSGYSLGGFGCWQFAGFAPGIFTAIVPVAGYCIGTLESEGMYQAPQPESSHRYTCFVNQYTPKLAKVPVIMAIHAVCDTNSSFRDTQALLNFIENEGGKPILIKVSDEAANSDGGKKVKKTGHGYIGHALLNISSERVTYVKLRAALDDAIAKGLGPVRGVFNPPAKSEVTPSATVKVAPPAMLQLCELCGKPSKVSPVCELCDAPPEAPPVAKAPPVVKLVGLTLFPSKSDAAKVPNDKAPSGAVSAVDPVKEPKHGSCVAVANGLAPPIKSVKERANDLAPPIKRKSKKVKAKKKDEKAKGKKKDKQVVSSSSSSSSAVIASSSSDSSSSSSVAEVVKKPKTV